MGGSELLCEDEEVEPAVVAVVSLTIGSGSTYRMPSSSGLKNTIVQNPSTDVMSRNRPSWDQLRSVRFE